MGWASHWLAPAGEGDSANPQPTLLQRSWYHVVQRGEIKHA
jgi:hypothetical protein